MVTIRLHRSAVILIVVLGVLLSVLIFLAGFLLKAVLL
jgi:hypothetical protein